jgi:hypothetical protein
MFKELRQFLEVGWKVTKEVHEISWFVPWLLALFGIPVVGIPAWAAWDNPNLRGLLIGLGFFLYAILFLCALGYVGYRATVQRKEYISRDPAAAILPIPDWTIRELFFYLAPGLQYGQLDNTHERVGQKIQDKFSTGEMKAWGRIIGNPTLVPIDPGNWVHSEFTYLFFGNEEGLNQVWSTQLREGHKYTGSLEYRDLQVNKNEALKIWPKPLEELISLKEATIRFYEQTRKAGNIWAYAAEKLGAHGLTGESTEEEILDYLSHYVGKKIVLYGGRPPSRLVELIDKQKLSSGQFKKSGTEFWSHSAQAPTYKELQVNNVELDFLIQFAKLQVI